MLKWFLLKDGDETVKALVSDVMEGKYDSILKFPKSYLSMVSDERPWKGKPHVTDLLNGPRMVFLKHTTDYAIDPGKSSFRVLGIQAHSKFENYSEFGEVDLGDENVIGRTDLLEDNGDGTFTVTDYKVVGSYKVAQAIGIYKERVDVLDDNGNQVVFKSGAKVGQVKTKLELRFDPLKADKKDWTRQLNIYRMLIQKQLHLKVTKLQIFAVVRDGGTIAAFTRGLKDNTYLVPIDIFEESVVNGFVEEHSKELLDAFETGKPRICTAEECWDGKRCREYCEVADACEAMGCEWLEKDSLLEEEE